MEDAWGASDVCVEGQEGKELLMPRERRVDQPLGLGWGREGRSQTSTSLDWVSTSHLVRLKEIWAFRCWGTHFE